MDGFRNRDRMNRGGSDRGSSDRYDRYDRYDRGTRGGSYQSSGAPEGVSAQEIEGIIEDSNSKQLDIIHDFFADAKDDSIASEKQIISAIGDLSKDLSAKIESSKSEPVVNNAAPASNGDENKTEIIKSGNDNKEEILKNISESKAVAEEILRTANSNNDLLASFAEEQVSMLIRGNTSTLNQITQSLEESSDLLQQILTNTSNISGEVTNIKTITSAANQNSAYDPMPAYSPAYSPSTGVNNNEEILNAANNNGALLNALRTEVASVQESLRNMESGLENRPQAAVPAGPTDENAPLDNEDLLTKSQADEMYKQLEEQVHSECVKVYRNLQKTLEDQNKAVIDGVGKGSGTTRIFALLAFIFALFNLIISFLTMLGIFPL